MTESDGAMLARQKELLIERLADFEATNRALRRMLRDRHEEEAAGGRLAEQRDLLLRKLSETEERVQVGRHVCVSSGGGTSGGTAGPVCVTTETL